MKRGSALLAALVIAGAAAACSTPGGAPNGSSPVQFIPLATAPPEATDIGFDETDAPTPQPLSIKKVDGAGSVGRGGTATVTIATVKGAECSIDVLYNSGSSTAKGLGDKTANSDGRVKWSWTVGTNTAKGSYPVTITCSKGDREGELDMTLTVK